MLTLLNFQFLSKTLSDQAVSSLGGHLWSLILDLIEIPENSS
jgi:hypothetical protein